MPVQIDPSALIASCNQNMTCTPTLIFWGVVAMAVVGVLQAISMLREKEEPKRWQNAEPSKAPEGFRWVLIPDKEQ